MKLYENDFIEYNWSNRPHRFDDNDEFSIRYRPCSRQPHNFREECIDVARKLAHQASQLDLPIRVLLSGGVDGEVVCRSFYDAGIPFQAVTIRYKRYHWSEWDHAVRYCKRYDIPHSVIDVDEDKILQEEVPKIAAEFLCKDPYVTFDIYRFKWAGGFPVFGTGDLVLEKKENGIISQETGSLNVPRQYQLKYKQPGCYQFFQYTPEIMLAFLEDPIIQKWIELAPELGFDDIRYFKTYMYKSHWPDMEARYKYYGYERFADKYFKLKEELARSYSYKRESVDIPLTTLLRQLKGEE